MLGLLPAIFLSAIDQTIVSVALVSIGRDLGRFDLSPWLIAGYLVASTVATPIYGKLSDLHGRRRLITIALSIHFVAAVLCTFAQTMPQLIVLRILQGMGSGGLLALTQASVADFAPGPERGRWQGYFSGMFAVAALVGPVLGGLLTHHFSWRAIFIFSLPLSLMALLMSRRVLMRRPTGERPRLPIDYAGGALLAATLASGMVALTRFGQGYRFDDPFTSGLAILCVLLLAAFVGQERRAADPLLPPAMIGNRVVRNACLVLAMQFFLLISGSTLLPMSMQALDHVGADGVAWRMIPLTLTIPFGSFLAGRWVMRIRSYRQPVTLGTCIAACSAFGVAWLCVSPIDGVLRELLRAPIMIALGIGLGLNMPPCLVAAQSAVAGHQVGVATATTALSRTLGGAMGIAVLSSVLFGLAGMVPMPGSDLPAAARLLEHAASPEGATQVRQAFGFVFLLAGIVSGASLLFSRHLPSRAPDAVSSRT